MEKKELRAELFRTQGIVTYLNRRITQYQAVVADRDATIASQASAIVQKDAALRAWRASQASAIAQKDAALVPRYLGVASYADHRTLGERDRCS